MRGSDATLEQRWRGHAESMRAERNGPALAAAIDHIWTHEPVRDIRATHVQRIGNAADSFRLATLLRIAERDGFVRWIPRVGWVANYEGQKSERSRRAASMHREGKPYIVRKARN